MSKQRDVAPGPSNAVPFWGTVTQILANTNDKKPQKELQPGPLSQVLVPCESGGADASGFGARPSAAGLALGRPVWQ